MTIVVRELGSPAEMRRSVLLAGSPSAHRAECSTAILERCKGNQPTTEMVAKRTTINSIRSLVGTLAWSFLIASSGVAQTNSSDVAATELVQQTVARELAATNSAARFMYRLHEEKAQGSETRVVVETQDFLISRLILKNGKPLPPSQKKEEEDRLRGLQSNRSQVARFKAEKHSDDGRVRKVLQALPDAFLYQSAGVEKDSNGRELTLVTFRPNSAFRPKTAELRMLQGIEGVMVIDSVAKRLVRIEAKLCRDIDFGWGFFGHIARGGRVLLEQEIVWQDQRAITTMELHITNRRLLVFTTRIDSMTKASNFRRLPDDLTLQQGLELLLDQDH